MENEQQRMVVNLESFKDTEEDTQNIPKTFLNIRNAIISHSLIFDENFNMIYHDFYTQNKYLIEEANYFKNNYKKRLEITLNGKQYLKNRKHVILTKMLKNVNLPPKTKIYLTLSQNIKFEKITKISEIIGASSLQYVYSQKKISNLIDESFSFEREVPAEKILKLCYIIKQIQKEFGISSSYMKMTSVILQKNEELLNYFWNKSLLNSSKSEENIYMKPKKLYAKKYSNYFCSICLVYGCFHYDSRGTYKSQYESLVYFPRKIKTSFTINWFLHYRCKGNPECFRIEKMRKILKEKSQRKNFKKFERKIIEYCQDFNMLNCCLIFLLLKKGSSDKTCSDIKYYLEEIAANSIDNENNNIKKLKLLSNGIALNKKKPIKISTFTPCYHKGIILNF